MFRRFMVLALAGTIAVLALVLLRPHMFAVPGQAAAHGDRMLAGDALLPGEYIASSDGCYRLVFQTDGNLVLYDSPFYHLASWASDTEGLAQTPGVTVMQTDGNLVMYEGSTVWWSSNTWGNPGSYLVMQTDGNAVIYRPDGTPIWATNTSERGFGFPCNSTATPTPTRPQALAPTPTPTRPQALAPTPTPSMAHGDRMLPGEFLPPGGSITSVNGCYKFTYQTDGDLVLYRRSDGQRLWASNTVARGISTSPGETIMQNNGDLVVYYRNLGVAWASNTGGNPGSRLVVQDNGNVVIYTTAMTPIWSTNTVQPDCVPSITPTTITPTTTPITPAVTPISPTATPITPTPGLSGLIGDANKDGQVNPVDATLVLQYSAGQISTINPNADANRSGQTDPIDATLILQYTAGLIGHLPP